MSTTYLATGKFTYNGAANNISELIYGCESAADAAEVADRMFARYSVYGGAYDCKVIASTTIAAPAAPAAVVAPAPVTRQARTMRCRRCGECGSVGAYPFSTLASSGLCDDCV